MNLSPVRLLLVSLVAAISYSVPAAMAEERGADFGKEVLPLLRERCFRCHEGRNAKAGVRLDLRSELLVQTGGDVLVVSGKSGESRLLKMVQGNDPLNRMPPEEPPLKPAQIRGRAPARSRGR